MPTRSPAQELDLQEVLLCTLPTPAPVDTDRVSPRHRLRSSLMLSDCQSSWIQQMPPIKSRFTSVFLQSHPVQSRYLDEDQPKYSRHASHAVPAAQHRSCRLEQRAYWLIQRHDHYFLAAGMITITHLSLHRLVTT